MKILVADDHVVKPFSPRDLVARVKAVLRRAEGLPARGPGTLGCGPVRLDRRKRSVEVAGKAMEGYERTIDAHMKNIRKVLGDDSENPRFIGTVRGVGYRFIEQADEA